MTDNIHIELCLTKGKKISLKFTPLLKQNMPCTQHCDPFIFLEDTFVAKKQWSKGQKSSQLKP